MTGIFGIKIWYKNKTSRINLTKTRCFAKIIHTFRVNNFVIF